MKEFFEENERTAPATDARKYVEVGPLDTKSGGRLPSVKVAYETWGELSPARDNAMLICHAVSGDSHAIGWWGKLIGPGKAIDTDRYFVIGNNLLGGCQGSTGPSSLAEDGQPYGSRFPIITIEDMVEVQYRLVQALGIHGLHAVIGGSMGCFLALEWARRQPLPVRKVFASAGCPRSNAMHIGFHETARQAILRDPQWRGGDYLPHKQPADGLAVARMIGHLTYLSPAAFETKFGRRMVETKEHSTCSLPVFQVESYLKHQGEGFTKRFDANSFLSISRAMDQYDVPHLKGAKSEFLFASFTSDWMYPPALSEELHQMALAAGCRSRHVIADLPFGHDSFLLDGEIQARALSEFLSNRSK